MSTFFAKVSKRHVFCCWRFYCKRKTCWFFSVLHPILDRSVCLQMEAFPRSSGGLWNNPRPTGSSKDSQDWMRSEQMNQNAWFVFWRACVNSLTMLQNFCFLITKDNFQTCLRVFKNNKCEFFFTTYDKHAFVSQIFDKVSPLEAEFGLKANAYYGLQSRKSHCLILKDMVCILIVCTEFALQLLFWPILSCRSSRELWRQTFNSLHRWIGLRSRVWLDHCRTLTCFLLRHSFVDVFEIFVILKDSDIFHPQSFHRWKEVFSPKSHHPFFPQCRSVVLSHLQKSRSQSMMLHIPFFIHGSAVFLNQIW